MSNDDSAWVKDASHVLGEDANDDDQESSFQVTMPYVVLQIMQRLEPNHSVQVNATGSTGKCCFCSLNLFCGMLLAAVFLLSILVM